MGDIRPTWVTGMMHRPNDPRTMPFYYDPNHYASVLLIGYAFLFGEFFDYLDLHNYTMMLAAGGALGVVGVAIITTGSRTGLGVMVGITGLVIGLKLFQRFGTDVFVVAGVLGVLSAGAVFALNASVMSILALGVRAETISEGLSLRFELWEAAAFTWWQNPIVGVGPGNFIHYIDWLPPELTPRKRAYPHNTYIGLLTGYGILGSIFAFGLVGKIVLSGARGISPTPNNQLITVFGALAGLLVVAITLDIFDSRRLWFVFGLTLAVTQYQRTSE